MSRAPLVIERILPAPPDVVFSHWSEPESLRLWMKPAEGMSDARVRLDFRVGGEFEIVMQGEQAYRQHGRYLAIDLDRRIEMEWISDWMPEGERETKLTVTFEPVEGEQTRLVLSHEQLPETDSYAGHSDGWARILSTLADELS